MKAMFFLNKKKAKEFFAGGGMEIFTPKELDDKAWAWLAEEDQNAAVSEWFLVREGRNLFMVIGASAREHPRRQGES